MTTPVIHWFRQDLRLADNPGLAAAAREDRPVVPLYILAEDGTAGRPRGGASRWWLHGSLEALGRDLEGRGSRLILRRGEPGAVLEAVAAETGARAIHWQRVYEPGEAALEQRLRARSGERVELRRFPGRLLHEPEAIRTGAGRPFQVFTAFWKACLAAPEPHAPVPVPARLRVPAVWPRGESLTDWGLRPTRPDWAGGLAAAWEPGEAAAGARLGDFLAGPLADYPAARDIPGRPGTSRLSPHLHFGELSPRQVWHAVRATAAAGQTPEPAAAAFLRELGWREFSAHLLWHWLDLPSAPLRPEFAAFPWSRDRALLAAWQRGETGYPIVDAGMRELWTTGWMHNRVRMIVASFLVKDLLIPWQDGEAWFWDTLVDADLANNAASWQWVAGCGADAAPFFRVFNPVLQGQKFDGDGSYVRRWLPALAALPGDFLHAPWAAPAGVLAAAGLRLGEHYPLPVVDHRAARQRALDAFAALRA